MQIKVTGGGNATPATTPATQLYTTNDGIVDIYTPGDKHGIAASTYKLPGPPVVSPVVVLVIPLVLTSVM